MIEAVFSYAISISFIVAISFYCWRYNIRQTLLTKRPTHEPSRPAAARTYRIRGIPGGWGPKEIEDLLSQQSCCTVKSLAAETKDHCLTATATFSGNFVPPKEISIPTSPLDSDFCNSLLVVDDDFLGITTLYMPSEEKHKLDIIAISGLGGHAFGSSKQRGGLHMWLRDSLPQDLKDVKTGDPLARVMIYGHESQVAGSNSMQNLADLASSFRQTLLSIMRADKPIIFIAHSLGGLIAKEALIRLAKSSQKADQAFLQNVYGVVFFGVPHHGMDSRSLRSMAGDGPNRSLIESLDQRNSHVLTVQRREFLEAFKDKGISFFCFYETEASPTAQQVNGIWSMSGPKEILVSQSSATICRPWEDESHYVCAVGRSHSDIVKFAPRDADYDRVLARLQSLANDATCDRVKDKYEMKLALFSDPSNKSDLSEIMEKIILEAEIKAVEEYLVVLKQKRNVPGHLEANPTGRFNARRLATDALLQHDHNLLRENLAFTDPLDNSKSQKADAIILHPPTNVLGTHRIEQAQDEHAPLHRRMDDTEQDERRPDYIPYRLEDFLESDILYNINSSAESPKDGPGQYFTASGSGEVVQTDDRGPAHSLHAVRQEERDWWPDFINEENVDFGITTPLHHNDLEKASPVDYLEHRQERLELEGWDSRKVPKDDDAMPLRVNDGVLDRQFYVPWKLGRDWKNVMKLLEKAFESYPELHMRILENRFEIVGPDGQIILPAVWNSIVRPGWKVTVVMANEFPDHDSTTRQQSVSSLVGWMAELKSMARKSHRGV